MIDQIRCPVCSSTDISEFIDISEVPVHCNILWIRREDALNAPKGDLRLGFCNNCGHIYNYSFNPDLLTYAQEYENSLFFSPRFQRYAKSLASRLVEHYELYNKNIIEIGCGQGDFLRLLCELGRNCGVGFDPSYLPEQSEGSDDITIIRDFYSEHYAHYEADVIVSRHVLEHVHQPCDFMSKLRHSIGNRYQTLVFFEVPNVLFTLRDFGIWDLIYEHCSYFSISSLRYLFETQGFELIKHDEVFQGQFLIVEAFPYEFVQSDFRDKVGNELRFMSSLTEVFSKNYEERVTTWRNKLDHFSSAGYRVVLWGCGSKGVSFLNTLKIGEPIEYVVDINPRKQGKYVPGTGQQVVCPERLKELQPDIVIVMNPIYIDEINLNLNQLDVTAEILAI